MLSGGSALVRLGWLLRVGGPGPPVGAVVGPVGVVVTTSGAGLLSFGLSHGFRFALTCPGGSVLGWVA